MIAALFIAVNPSHPPSLSPGETTLVGEPRPGALGRHASYTLDHQEPERGTATAAKGEEQELSIFSMYNNPLGYL